MKPSPTELVILKHLWRSGPQSIGEIHSAVQAQLDWSRSSSRKTVERMVDKGLLDQREQHGLNIYRAKAKKIPTLAALIRSFAQDVLDLDGPLPVSNLVETRLLDPDELEELEAFLQENDGDPQS